MEECSICYEIKIPHVFDDVGCKNYKLICVDCKIRLTKDECPFCNEVHYQFYNSIKNSTNDNILFIFD